MTPPSREAPDVVRLEALARAATPGEHHQMSGKYISFDYGETPQVFRAITQADEDFIAACSPEAILTLLAALAELRKERDSLRAAAIAYLRAWNDLRVPGDDGDAALIALAEACRLTEAERAALEAAADGAIKSALRGGAESEEGRDAK